MVSLPTRIAQRLASPLAWACPSSLSVIYLCLGVERLVLCLASFPKLLVAAVNGLTSGLGLSLLPLCDLVYASDKATFNSLAARWDTILLTHTVPAPFLGLNNFVPAEMNKN